MNGRIRRNETDLVISRVFLSDLAWGDNNTSVTNGKQAERAPGLDGALDHEVTDISLLDSITYLTVRDSRPMGEKR